MYDVERFGIINCGNPKHADVFLVTGSVNEQNKGIVKQIYEQMPEPKVVVAVGICACSGGVFRDCYNVLGGVDQVIPVDAYVPGCAARPEAIIDAVVKGLGVLQAKRDAMVNAAGAPAEAEVALSRKGVYCSSSSHGKPGERHPGRPAPWRVCDQVDPAQGPEEDGRSA